MLYKLASESKRKHKNISYKRIYKENSNPTMQESLSVAVPVVGGFASHQAGKKILRGYNEERYNNITNLINRNKEEIRRHREAIARGLTHEVATIRAGRIKELEQAIDELKRQKYRQLASKWGGRALKYGGPALAIAGLAYAGKKFYDDAKKRYGG